MGTFYDPSCQAFDQTTTRCNNEKPQFLVSMRNCCLARMLPGEAENGVGMNRSVRDGKKCKAV